LFHHEPLDLAIDGFRDTRQDVLNLKSFGAEPGYGIAAYSIVRDSLQAAQQELDRITDVKQSAAGYKNYQQWIAGTQLDQNVSLNEYSVSNRGLRAGLIGTPQMVIDQIGRFQEAGIDLLLLQCSPQFEEMERFAEEVIKPIRGQ